MPDDPAAYLAHRIRTEYAIDGLPTDADLLGAAESRGCPVIRSLTLRTPGVYVRDPDHDAWAIILRDDAPTHVLAHELAEHILADNAAHGITYEPPWWERGTPHEIARRFEYLLCGPKPQ